MTTDDPFVKWALEDGGECCSAGYRGPDRLPTDTADAESFARLILRVVHLEHAVGELRAQLAGSQPAPELQHAAGS